MRNFAVVNAILVEIIHSYITYRIVQRCCQKTVLFQQILAQQYVNRCEPTSFLSASKYLGLLHEQTKVLALHGESDRIQNLFIAELIANMSQ